MLSQKEIAKQLNLSQATVSRALRNDKALSLETILKVKELVRETGHVSRRYTNNKVLEVEHNNSKRLLALIYGKIDSHTRVETIALEIIQGLLNKAKEYGFELIIKNVDSIATAKTIVADYSNNSIGCLTILRFPKEIINYINSNFNCISINHHYDELNIKVIEPDQESAFFQMYQTMYDRGHRKIGFLTIANSNVLMIQRYAGFFRGSRQFGLKVNPSWIMNVTRNVEYEFPEMLEHVIKLYKKDGVRAFLCASGSLAKKLIAELEKREIKVPEDISFGAFDEVVIPMDSGHQLFGAQACYNKMTGVAINALQHFELFRDISCISCPPDFLYGDTIAELKHK